MLVCLDDNFELDDLHPKCSFTGSTLSRSGLMVKKGQSSRPQEENVAKVVGATSSDGSYVYKVGQKTWPQTHDHNSVKS